MDEKSFNNCLFTHPRYESLRCGFAVWLHEVYGAVEASMRAKTRNMNFRRWELAGVYNIMEEFDRVHRPYGEVKKDVKDVTAYISGLPRGEKKRLEHFIYNNFGMAWHTLIDRFQTHKRACPAWERYGLNPLFEKYMQQVDAANSAIQAKAI